jgi:aspartate aminotransferase-like enzyme
VPFLVDGVVDRRHAVRVRRVGRDAASRHHRNALSSPGLSFVALSDRAVAGAGARLPRSYWNFAEIRREVTGPKPGTPGTPPVHAVLRLPKLRMIHEGFESVCASKWRRGCGTRRLCSVSKSSAVTNASTTTVTALALPAGIAPDRVRDG